MTSTSNDIVKGLEPLFERADKEGLWFYCSYQNLWFSPEELRKEQANGRFRWGYPNWDLRDPADEVAYLERTIERYQEDLASLKSRITAAQRRSLPDG